MSARISALRVDDLVTPLGIDSPAPLFSWEVGGIAQSRYEIRVSSDEEFSPVGEVWRSGWVEDFRPFGHRYAGPELISRTRYWWKVRISDDRLEGRESPWSDASWFETGQLHERDWSGQWISDSRSPSEGTLYFRSEFALDAAPLRARAYVSALGWYKFWVNGEDITGSDLVPRFTPFDEYVEYQTYDITRLLRPGLNVLNVVVSEGRFRGRLGPHSKPQRFGDRLGMIAQVEVEKPDGGRLSVNSDRSWTVGSGRITYADPKFGERADLRVDDAAWLASGGTAKDERAVAVLPTHPRRLIAEEVERVTRVDTLQGHVTTTPRGLQLIDFGQNFNGYARLPLNGPAGATAIIRYSEVLTPDGELDTEYLHFPGAKREDWFQRDEVILSGEAVEYAPSFSVRGFRYVSVEGSTHPLSDEEVEGIVISSDLVQTATFSCSDPRLERLWENSRWSMISNFADTPTDCPTRERSGWTGDIQVFGPTAAILADTQAYLRRYLRNVAADQFDDGTVPPVIPSETSSFVVEKDRMLEMAKTSVGWGDVTVMLPWTLYRYFGDTDVLERQYDSARAWVEFLERRAQARGVARRFRRGLGSLENYIVDTGFNWGEWLRPGESPASQMAGNLLTGRPEVATAYFAHSARLLSEMAGVLGRDEDHERFALLARRATEAYNAAFVRRGGSRIGADRQDDYVRALAFDLLAPESKPGAVSRLVELIEDKGGHLDTGFLSTALLLPVLSDNGHEDIAWKVLLNPTSPSWLAQIERGATTIWETWEGYGSDGRANDSHNHYAFGSVTRWLQEYVAGIRPLAPGYRTFLVSPSLGDLTSVRASLATPYGAISAHWEQADSGRTLHLVVPVGTRAEVALGDSRQWVDPGEYTLSWPSAADTTARSVVA
ncbi:alpha-L-rhamnosidase [Microbacterium sp. Leaf159]|uniref:alpha-L-rhamnosidase n=1 Tax=Microbacterium sp. Leaf159 TaxID=1736279 RepID=UPI0007017B1B|nr:alpha-L-rhamnosidase [Microbacterium sp. Leaf159]KQR39333.1 hypothetical protein ASF80_07915 [Microbacterium sp. Leaf159]